MEFAGRYRSGKLLSKRFVRIKVLKDRKPFTRRIVKSNKSYAFAIASDISGSMFPHRASKKDPGSYALSSMHMAGEALRLASIQRAMIIFGENARVVAPMGKTQIQWSQLTNENEIDKANSGSTYINKAIDLCANELNKIRAERKIMIILTDGSSDLYDMQKSHKKATDQGIECLGIEIGDQGNSYMNETFSEKKNTKVENTQNTELIGKAFIDILKRSITKSS
jgi:hypothetical protein